MPDGNICWFIESDLSLDFNVIYLSCTTVALQFGRQPAAAKATLYSQYIPGLYVSMLFREKIIFRRLEDEIIPGTNSVQTYHTIRRAACK